jgi:hypothetical protein
MIQFLLSLSSGDGLSLFQSGDLPDRDEEWHKLAPPEAREALGEKEVQRQSVLFELFKSERDYVHDLELVEEVLSNSMGTDRYLIRAAGFHISPKRCVAACDISRPSSRFHDRGIL